MSYSYINSDGKILTDFIYDGIEKFEDGQAKAYYSYSSKVFSGVLHGTTEHLLDKDGNVLSSHSEYDDSGQQESNWEDWRDDAFEGDSEAYWNID